MAGEWEVLNDYHTRERERERLNLHKSCTKSKHACECLGTRLITQHKSTHTNTFMLSYVQIKKAVSGSDLTLKFDHNLAKPTFVIENR